MFLDQRENVPAAGNMINLVLLMCFIISSCTPGFGRDPRKPIPQHSRLKKAQKSQTQKKPRSLKNELKIACSSYQLSWGLHLSLTTKNTGNWIAFLSWRNYSSWWETSVTAILIMFFQWHEKLADWSNKKGEIVKINKPITAWLQTFERSCPWENIVPSEILWSWLTGF